MRGYTIIRVPGVEAVQRLELGAALEGGGLGRLAGIRLQLVQLGLEGGELGLRVHLHIHRERTKLKTCRWGGRGAATAQKNVINYERT